MSKEPPIYIERVITVRLSKSDHERAREAAYVKKTSLNRFCLTAIQAAIG